jgi:hypothetical protein
MTKFERSPLMAARFAAICARQYGRGEGRRRWKEKKGNTYPYTTCGCVFAVRSCFGAAAFTAVAKEATARFIASSAGVFAVRHVGSWWVG